MNESLQAHTLSEPATNVTESTPLLSNPESANNITTSLSENQTKRFFGVEIPNYYYTLALCLLWTLVADSGGAMSGIPEVRLLEMAVCRDFYRVHDPAVIGPPPLSYIDEHLCKLDVIQSHLAYLRATKSILDMLPGMLILLQLRSFLLCINHQQLIQFRRHPCIPIWRAC
jgi:hypothetical protein